MWLTLLLFYTVTTSSVSPQQQSEAHFQKTYMLLIIIFKLEVKTIWKHFHLWAASSCLLWVRSPSPGVILCARVETANTQEPVPLENDDVMIFFEHM